MTDEQLRAELTCDEVLDVLEKVGYSYSNDFSYISVIIIDMTCRLHKNSIFHEASLKGRQ